MSDDGGPRTLTTVERTCEILAALKELDGAGVTEIAEHIEMSKGGAYNHLATLHDQEFVVKMDDEYRLSGHFFNMGEYVKHRDPLYTVSRPVIDQLAEETGESAHLMIEQFGKGFYYHKAQGQKGISEEFHLNLLEETDYLHWSSTGKAVLAELSEERARSILKRQGMPKITEFTKTDPDELFKELEEVREQGYALNDEEQIRGARAVGAAITTYNDNVLGAISISGPTSRIDDEKFHETYPELVRRMKNVIEVNLETQDGQTVPEL